MPTREWSAQYADLLVRICLKVPALRIISIRLRLRVRHQCQGDHGLSRRCS